MFSIILAHNSEFGLGLNGTIPWKNPYELKLFREITDNSILIMGRKTVEHLPHLKNRTIFCISSKETLESDNNNCLVFKTLEQALETASSQYPDKKIFVAGGAQLFRHALEDFSDRLIKVYVSIIQDSTLCDVHFDIYKYLGDWNIIFTKNGPQFTHYVLQKENKEEEQYLSLLEEVLEKGQERKTRNSITKSLFHKSMTYDLRKGFPLLTTKKMFFKGIVEELLFFLRGDTDSNLLEEKGVNIWKLNTDRKFLDNIGKTERKEGMMGPMYGYQWRYFNSDYDENTGKPKSQGVDQLKMVVDMIRNDPTSRRIMMSCYNPNQAEEGVLYPCHSIILQFYVTDKYLDMFCYNRSQDLFLGTPFNIASSALLLTIIAKITGLCPRNLHMTLGDVHIYKNHYPNVQEQLNRIPYSFPKLEIKEISTIEDIETLKFEDIILKNYQCYPTIKAEMIA